MDKSMVPVLEKKANEIRKDVINMLTEAGSGHAGGSLGAADIMAVLYFSGFVNNFPENPHNEGRDRILLSSGHICPVWYAALAEAGYFSKEKLMSLRKTGGIQGHPWLSELPGVENTSGSLGQGLAQAIGQALAARMDGKSWRVYCILSDGELEEGSNWEALMLAPREKLDNLTVIISRNGTQIDGNTEEIMPLEPLAEKLRAFNWQVREADGNNIGELAEALEEVKNYKGKPGVIVARTISGRGVAFMEGKYEWHGKVPNNEEAKEALKLLEN